jgi:hypothetical protein
VGSRLIAGLEHPPLQESNCPEMNFVLEKSKSFRDAIAHASPWSNIGDPKSDDKLSQLFQIHYEDAEHTVDNVLKLVRKIDRHVSPETTRLFWLRERADDGYFPASVFD